MSEELYCPNIRFGTFDLDIIDRDGELKLDGFTAVLVISDSVPDDIVKKFAKILLTAGCRDFAFCGVESDKWHRLFDEVDIERTEDDEDYATTWEIDGIDEIPDELCICKDDTFIFCTDNKTVRKCHTIISDAGYGFKARYTLDVDSVAMTKDKVYTVLSVEKGWYRVLTELDEDYLFPPKAFERICRQDPIGTSRDQTLKDNHEDACS